MKNILIHGLGQNSKDWDTIKNELETREISPIVPDLFDLTKGRELDYPTVYQAFSEMSESYKDKLNLCGLSLGGLLALNYAIQYPKKINSLVLIGTPFEIPKGLLKFQNFVFKLIPKSAFQNMGAHPVVRITGTAQRRRNGGTELYGVGGNARLPYSYSLRRKG